MKGIGGHQSALMGNDEWLTPLELLKPLGAFDLDPCSPIQRPWATADRHFTKWDNGLIKEWTGRIWLNPPYGRDTGKWLARLSEHGNGIALIFARTETDDWFRYVWPKASAILFLQGRLHFHYVDGSRATANSGAPSALIAYGAENVSALKDAGLKGQLIYLR